MRGFGRAERMCIYRCTREIIGTTILPCPARRRLPRPRALSRPASIVVIVIIDEYWLLGKGKVSGRVRGRVSRLPRPRDLSRSASVSIRY